MVSAASSSRIASLRGRHSGQASLSHRALCRKRHDAVRHCNVGHDADVQLLT
jgi:hypothetical protein